MFNKKIIRAIKGKFQLNLHSCKPTVNEEVDNCVDRTNLEIACLISNYKKIYFTSKRHILNKLDPILQIHLPKIKRIDYRQYFLSEPVAINQQIIMIPHYEAENRTILYNKEGTKQAFLLFLRDTEKNLNEFYNPGSWAESDNHCLTGLLLCYPKKDILFFYKVAAFKEHLIVNDNYQKFKSTEKNAFASWPKIIKKEFYDFLNQLWLKSAAHKIYKRDQREANTWLKKYEHISIKKITQATNELLTQVTILNQNYLASHKLPT